jgi:regulator of sigma E protease
MSVVSTVVAIVALALLIVLHEGGHFLVARLCGMRVERFSIGFGNPLFSFKRGATIYQIAPIPLGGFVQITGLNPHEEFDKNDPYVYPNRPRWMRMAVLVAGPAANYLTACILALFVFSVYGREVVVNGELVSTNKVERAIHGTPADQAGLKHDDELFEANGRPLSDKLSIRDVVRESKGQPVLVKFRRGGQEQSVTVTPKRDGDKAPYIIGVELQTLMEKVPIGTAFRDALVMPVVYSGDMLKNIGKMLTGKQKPSFSGPVGITRVLAQTAEEGPMVFFRLVMYLSIYLGLFNLLPLPALDGGRVLFLGINSLRTKELNAKTEATVHMVGLALLLGLFVIVTFNDIKVWVSGLFKLVN